MSFDFKKAYNVLQKIQNDRGAYYYFFKNVHSPEWFEIFQKEGYLEPQKNPPPFSTDGKSWSIPRWEILSYFEKLTAKSLEDNNINTLKDILAFIKRCVLYKDKEGNHIDNSTTWWVFANIICQMPNEIIDIETIDLLPIFMNGRFDNSLSGSDLATKLLPKLLSGNQEDIPKAEKLFLYLTDFKFKPSKFKTSLSGLDKEEAYPLLDTYWLNQSLIVNGVAKKMGEICTDELILNYISKLKKLLLYENLPKLYRPEKGPLSGKSIFLTFVKDELINFDLGLVKENSESEKDISVSNLSSFQVEIKNGQSGFIEKCLSNINFQGDMKQELTFLLKRIYRDLFDDYSSTYLRRIGNSSLGESNKIKNVLINVLLELINQNKKQRYWIEILLNENYQVMKRVALFMINNSWNGNGDLFWKCLNEQHHLIFDDPNYEPEIHEIFKNHGMKFNEDEINKIISFVEEGPDYDFGLKNRELHIKYWKQKKYYPLKDIPVIKDKYLRLKSETNAKEHFNYESGVVWSGNISPFSQKEFDEKSNKELVEYFYNFKPGFGPNEPTVEGLANTLKNSVLNNPTKYTSDLYPFFKCPYYYLTHLINGFDEALKKEVPFDWEPLIKFFLEYFNNDEFWADKYLVNDEMWRANFEWVISSYSWLVRSGLNKNLKNSIPIYMYAAIKSTFEILIRKTPNKEFVKNENSLGLMTYSINTNQGRICEVIFSVYINEYNLDIKNHEKIIQINNYYKNILNPKLESGLIETLVLFGNNLRNLFLMNRGWFNEIKTKSLDWESEKFLAFMEGYLFDHQVIKPLFDLLKPHYLRMLNEPKLNEHLLSDLMVHLGVIYLNGTEEEQKICFGIIDEWKLQFIEQLIFYFHSVEEQASHNDEHTKRVVILWEYLDKLVKNHGDEDKGILDTVGLLAGYLKNIDEKTFHLLMNVIQNTRDEFRIYTIIENLNRLKDSGNIKDIAEYYSKMLLLILNKLDEFRVSYKSSEITEILKYLYNSGNERARMTTKEFFNKCMDLGYSMFDTLQKEFETQKREM